MGIVIQILIIIVVNQIGKLYTHQREVFTISYNETTEMFECNVYDLHVFPILCSDSDKWRNVWEYPYLDNILVLECDGQKEQFVNRDTREVSHIYSSVKAYQENKIAYLNPKNKLIIRDIFDQEQYYVEINRDFYTVSEVKFLADDMIQIKYQSSDVTSDDDEVVETINLARLK